MCSVSAPPPSQHCLSCDSQGWLARTCISFSTSPTTWLDRSISCRSVERLLELSLAWRCAGHGCGSLERHPVSRRERWRCDADRRLCAGTGCGWWTVIVRTSSACTRRRNRWSFARMARARLRSFAPNQCVDSPTAFASLTVPLTHSLTHSLTLRNNLDHRCWPHKWCLRSLYSPPPGVPPRQASLPASECCRFGQPGTATAAPWCWTWRRRGVGWRGGRARDTATCGTT